MKEKRGYECEPQICHGSRKGHQHHIPAGIVELAEIDRNRFGIPEHDSATRHHQQERRQQDRAERVDVAKRIERNAPQSVGRVVAEFPRNIAVGGLVERDGDQHGNNPDGYLVCKL